jgi:Ca2+-binding RTX toxin-like protein
VLKCTKSRIISAKNQLKGNALPSFLLFATQSWRGEKRRPQERSDRGLRQGPNVHAHTLKESNHMIRNKTQLLKGLVITLTSVLPATLLAGCSSEVSDPKPEEVSESAAELGVAVPTCSTAGSSGYNTTSSNLTLTMNTPNVVIGVVGGFVTVNGYICVKGTGVQLTPAMVKKITINGTSANNEKVVVDMLSGSFGPSVLATTGGIVVDLVSGTGDSFSLRGTAAADKYTAGTASGDSYFEVSGDAVADIRVSNADSMAVSLSGGSDTFYGRGGSFAATHLGPGTITALTALAAGITVNGGDGDDTITGGDGIDTLSGGNGNDLFKTSTGASGDGADTYSGGAGNDKIDYSGRTSAVAVLMDGAKVSGQGFANTWPATPGGSIEGDLVGADIEDLVGGTNNDILQGNQLANNIKGGTGNDIIWGGPAGTCLTDIDVLDGEAGDDTFAMTATSDCGDSLTGGIGNDTADYQLRTLPLIITLDGGAVDGETNEKDNVKADIEVVIGGTDNDVFTGSAANDTFHGGAGNDTLNGGAGDDILVGGTGVDTLNGEAGNDTFDEGLTDALIVVAQNKGGGGDIINGGSGFDTVTYAERTATLAVTLCMDPSKITGASTLTGVCADSDGASGEGDKIVNVTHLIGGTLDDQLTGSTGDDTIEGGAGNDTIHGGAGSDIVFGDADDDFVYGDAGDDTMDGGAGDDLVNGDTAVAGAGSNIADGDICTADAADTTVAAANCDL